MDSQAGSIASGVVFCNRIFHFLIRSDQSVVLFHLHLEDRRKAGLLSNQTDACYHLNTSTRVLL